MKKKLLIISCLFFAASVAYCQELTKGDTLEIKRQARFCIIQFGDILNQLAKPDEYFRKYNVDNFISKFYEDDARDQIFRDSVVLVEDDLNPNSRPPTFEEEKPIQRYLNDFFQFYEKSVGTSVVFSDIQVSDIQQGEYLYVNVTYENEFLNRHKYIDEPYQKYKRVATVKAERSNTGWKVLITYVGFYRTPTIDPKEATNPPPSVTTEEVIPVEDTLETEAEEPAVTAKKGSFSNVNDTYKRGESINISWNQEFDNPVNLSLYQGNIHKESLNPGLTNNEFTGAIPKKIRPGETYNFQLYDPVSKMSLQSGNFSVRRKIPLGIQIPVYIGVGVAAYLIIDALGGGNGGGGETTETQPFPEPPAPVDN